MEKFLSSWIFEGVEGRALPSTLYRGWGFNQKHRAKDDDDDNENENENGANFDEQIERRLAPCGDDCRVPASYPMRRPDNKAESNKILVWDPLSVVRTVMQTN